MLPEANEMLGWVVIISANLSTWTGALVTEVKLLLARSE